MVHRNILKSFHKLPGKVQKRVARLIEEFQEDPHSPAIGMHPLPGTMLDPKVRGVKKLPDGYRAIVIAPEQGDTYLLVHIDAHDKAYDWAKNKRFEVHGATGVFQVFDTDQVEAIAPAAEQAEAEETEYPLQKLSPDELFAAGVPRPLIPAVRSIRSDEGMEALLEYLPPDCRDMLYGLAAGMSVEEAFREMLGAAPAEASETPRGGGDFSHLQAAPNFDLVLVEDEAALKEILTKSLEEWRVFLHPYQRKLVRRNTNGPMNITGAAGTGKTVALIHRAVHLAQQLSDPKDRILLTTFTTNLSVTIGQQIEQLDPNAARRIEVTNLHALARTICSRSGWRGRIADASDMETIWRQVLPADPDEMPLSPEEMRLEYEFVVDANGVDDEEDYLTTVRSGRGRLGRKQRRAAWRVFREFRRELKRRDLLTFEGAVHQARLAAEQGNFQRYRHVLVDEAQDFSLEALRLVRAISPVAVGLADPLCLAGDGHQRIYRAKIPMSRAEIFVRGRSSRLKINYRTTEQIRRFAQGILQGAEIDDLDGHATDTVADHSLIRGAEPRLVACGTSAEQAEAVLRWVQELLAADFATHEICVTPLNDQVQSILRDNGIATHRLRPRQVDPGAKEPGVRMGTMQRVKGLEYRAVALLCSDPGDPMNAPADAPLRARCERYVAATRAREQLLVTTAK